MNKPFINTNKYNYYLPKGRIAMFPLSDRSGSKLMVIDKNSGTVNHHYFSEIHNFLPRRTLLILNDSKVIQARIFGKKASGGKVEFLCTEPGDSNSDIHSALQTKSNVRWKCIIGGRNIKENSIIRIDPKPEINLDAQILSRFSNEALVEFSWQPGDISFAEILDKTGIIPLPPYINRNPVSNDNETYQTVYADNEGSIAAPTAGLHFTPVLLDEIRNSGICTERITLHVGLGTFKPIESHVISDHIMHSEIFSVTKNTILKIYETISGNNPVIATGTTTIRTLESLYWLGAKLISKETENLSNFEIEQWFPYQKGIKCSALEALNAVLNDMENNNIDSVYGKTSIIIVPGYEFKICSGLITNFHLPGTTLILLVAAFLGDDLWRKAYESALENKYRFLSYGDATLCLAIGE